MSSGLASRRAALGLLGAVMERRQPLDEALSHDRKLAALDPRDRAFARHLVATTLRRLGQIDGLIERALDRPLKARHAKLRNLLRLGACQIAFLGTPAHAAVDTGVALAQGARLTAYRGLVNAVLRRLAREAPALVGSQEADGSAARRNTPGWLWESWCAAYGEATAQAIAAAHLAEPPLDLTLKDEAGTAAWAARLDARVLPTGGLRLAPGRGEVAGLAGYGDGAWWVQDAAAALPARLLAPLLASLPGQPVIDLCAAPGGKTAQLAAAGARVTAVDHSPQRLRRLAGNLERLGLSATLVEADARAWRPSRPAAAVLLDAPCSATGTLRRHPDIAHLRGPESLAPLLRLQDELLAAAVEMLAPGGRLVYATCSLQPEEGRGRIDAALAGGAPLVRDPVAAAEVGGLDGLLTAEGDLRSLPSQLPDLGGLDGFYACRLRRA